MGFKKLSAALVVVGLLLTGDALATSPKPEIHWNAPPLDRGFTWARQQRDRRLLVKFDASWCPSCRALNQQVFQSPEGFWEMNGLMAFRVDFDDPANRSLVESYVILGLPTVLLLDGAGQQVGRVSGFEDKAAWLTEFKEARQTGDPLPALRARVQATPTHPGHTLELGRALLVRGDIAEGLTLLERVGTLDHQPGHPHGAYALFLQGRYYHRVKQDPRRAQVFWHTLVTGHPDSDYAGSALWWYARAQHELKQPQVAIDLFDAQAKGGNTSALPQWFEFVIKHQLSSQIPRLRTAIKTRLQHTTSPKERATLQTLLQKFTR